MIFHINVTIGDINLFTNTNANIPSDIGFNMLNVNGGIMLLDKDSTNFPRIYGGVEPRDVGPSSVTLIFPERQIPRKNIFMRSQMYMANLIIQKLMQIKP